MLVFRYRVSIQDAILVIAALLVALFLALEYDILRDQSRPVSDRERALELDELLGLGAMLLVGLLVFSWRRVRAYKIELARRIAAEQDAYASARHDSLTGLPNKRLFTELAGEALGKAWEAGSKCAVLFIDLDRFKPVNDTFGHAVGDALLVELAGRLRECFPAPDVVARIGGDEFAALVVESKEVVHPN